MPQFAKETLKLILDLISRFPDGAAIEEILLGLSPPPSRRTLQYRLSSMVKQGLIVTVGKARAMKYKLPEQTRKEKGIIPLSQKGFAIQLEVTKPIHERAHVTYHREFLDQYVPNQTFYLSAIQRKELMDLGRTDGNRPAGTYARQIYNRLLIDLSWNSSRLEGNTYSLLETERLLEFGVAAEDKDARETQMILNHKKAIAFIVESAEFVRLNRYTICNLHALLADELILDQACGQLRSIAVAIGGSVYLPLAIPQLINECFTQILETAEQIQDPFERAFFLMVHLPYLQPFEDVNKRVSRLTANLILIRENLCPLSFVELPEQVYINGLLGIYELNQMELLRDVFIWAYEKSCHRYLQTRQTLGEPDPFRIRYSKLRKALVALIVKEAMNKPSAILAIQQRAHDSVPLHDRDKFVDVVENELTQLHEGNIARYDIELEEFRKWQQVWVQGKKRSLGPG